jgi:UDP:flavonoid glycosyltransferase YjiC (YdhE family)
MRVLMTTTGYPGHLLPLVPFARACVRAGHDVRVAGPRFCGALVAELGLTFRACADPSDEEVGRIVASLAKLPPRDGHARMMAKGFGSVAARAILADLLELVAGWQPNVVVHESQEFAAGLAAERHGVPHARVALGLASTEDETLSFAGAEVDELRAELGLPRDPHAEQLRGSPYLTLVPPALEQPGLPGPRVTHRFREVRASASPLPDWWTQDDGPVVYLTFGSVAGSLGFFPPLYQAAIERLAGLHARVLVTTGADADPAELGPLPPNVHAERWVAQEIVLAHAAAVVCHGGYGSVLGPLAHGLPLVVIPIFGGDQWHNARRVAAVGAGIALEGEPRAERRMLDMPEPEVFAALPDAIEQLLGDPGYGRAARRIAGAIDALPPIDAAVDVLQAIADRGRAMDACSGRGQARTSPRPERTGEASAIGIGRPA